MFVFPTCIFDSIHLTCFYHRRISFTSFISFIASHSMTRMTLRKIIQLWEESNAHWHDGVILVGASTANTACRFHCRLKSSHCHVLSISWLLLFCWSLVVKRWGRRRRLKEMIQSYTRFIHLITREKAVKKVVKSFSVINSSNECKERDNTRQDVSLIFSRSFGPLFFSASFLV